MKVEIRFHGRGGQGTVIASKLLAQAYAIEYPDLYVQAFPEFGAERRGAPVTAFLRLANKQKNRIVRPDHVIILDDELITEANALSGLKNNGWIVLNTNRPDNFAQHGLTFNYIFVDAAKIALEFGIGQKTQPIVNTVILGAFALASRDFEQGLLSLNSVEEAIRISEEIPNPEKNIEACEQAFGEARLWK